MVYVEKNEQNSEWMNRMKSIHHFFFNFLVNQQQDAYCSNILQLFSPGPLKI